MTPTHHPAQPLYRRPVEPTSVEQPFEGDLFGRKSLADRMTTFLGRLPDGAVIAVDAPWGEGKTWFGRHWHAQLVADGYRTAYIDCFQRDHVEDPFLMIAGELLEMAKAGKPASRRALMQAGKKLGAALLPAAAKFALNAAGHWAVGNARLGADVAKAANSIEESAAASLEKFVSKRLEDYESDKKSVSGFRQALADMAAEGAKPVVVFVDELDRCRPDFAVRTVERVKHFFEVPRVVFVLLMNRRQLVAAIEGVYGPRVEADAYLGKFVQLSLTLPKQVSMELHSEDDNRKHCESTLARYGFPSSGHTTEFTAMFGVLACRFGLSLRDIERVVILFSIAQPMTALAMEFAWPIALKLKHPELFRRLLADEAAAHAEAYKLASDFAAQVSGGADRVLTLLAELHNSGATGFKNPLPQEQVNMMQAMNQIRGPKQLLRALFQRVDLSVAT